jgi:hypothetical protein
MEPQPHPQSPGSIKPETPDSPITISFRRRDVETFYVFDHELATIGSASAQSALHNTLFGAGFGAAISLWVTVFTVEIKNPNTYATFWALSIVSTIMAIYFGIRSFIDFRQAKKQITAIREASPKRELQSKVVSSELIQKIEVKCNKCGVISTDIVDISRKSGNNRT